MIDRKPIWAALHVIVMVCVLVSVLTGLRIAVLDHQSILRFSYFLPQGQMHEAHLISAFIFTSVVFLYGYLLYQNRFRLNKSGHDKQNLSRQNQSKQEQNKYNQGAEKRTSDKVQSKIATYHQTINRLLYIICFVNIISGSVLLLDSTLLDKSLTLLIHYYAALALIAYLFLHGGVYIVQFGLPVIKLMFYPFKKWRKEYGVFLSFWALAILFLGYVLTLNLDHGLVVKRIDENAFIKIDGKADEPLWQEAQMLTINTHGGANFDDGSTPISIRGLHTGFEAYFFVEWDDPTKSLNHLPLVKTADGWKVKEQGFYKFDEKEYYEDKFAMMLANQCDLGAGGTAHLGPKPLADKPKNWSGKGYHYSEKGLVDLWHWKAIRTNKMRLMDDNYIDSPDIAREGSRRYTGGYQTDARESGDYRMNWNWYSPSGVTPKRLPTEKNYLKPYQVDSNSDVNGIANTANKKQNGELHKKTGIIPWYGSAPYKEENDTYPLGTIMPSILYTSNKFEGDRAHVRAFAQWSDGKWSLEIFRKLETGSSKDVAITDGICMWLAAFDHAQIAHTRHNRAIKIRLEQ